MKASITPHRLLWAAMGCPLLSILSGCLGQAETTAQGYSLSAGQTDSTQYSETALLTEPSFTFSNGASQEVTLAAYRNSSCTERSDGALQVAQNPMMTSNGIAQFSGVSYALPGHFEETLYLGATASSGLLACSSPIQFLQHFNLGVGYTALGTTGAAGASGVAEIDLGNGHAIDSLGRLIVAGTSANAGGGFEMAIWRFNPDGTLDTTFNGVGYVVSGTTGAAGGVGAGENDAAEVLQIDSLGRYVVAGDSKNAAGGTEMAIWRYLPNGNLDTTFASTGFAVSGPAGLAGQVGASETDTDYAFLIDPQGKYLLVGGSQAPGPHDELAMIRFNPDGTLDSTFNGTGTLVYSVGASIGFGVTVDAEGRYLISGGIWSGAGGDAMGIWRYNVDGSLDTTFLGTGIYESSTTGIAGALPANELDHGEAISVDGLGRIIVVGISYNGLAAREVAIWRFNSDGSADTSFGGVGYVVSGAAGAAGAVGAAVQDEPAFPTSFGIDSQGRYVISGDSRNAGSGSELAIWRFNSDGTPDLSLGGAGYVTSGSTGAAGATAALEFDSAALTIDAQGRYVITGNSSTAAGGVGTTVVVWRYKPDGTLDL